MSWTKCRKINCKHWMCWNVLRRWNLLLGLCIQVFQSQPKKRLKTFLWLVSHECNPPNPSFHHNLSVQDSYFKYGGKGQGQLWGCLSYHHPLHALQHLVRMTLWAAHAWQADSFRFLMNPWRCEITMRVTGSLLRKKSVSSCLLLNFYSYITTQILIVYAERQSV